MSFLNLRKKKTEKKEEPKHLAVASVPAVSVFAGTAGSAAAGVLHRPRVSEKALLGQARGVYVFDVASTANKQTIAKAIFALYKVKPRKVTVTAISAKTVMMRGKAGQSGGGKKASVYLKKGEKIEIV